MNLIFFPLALIIGSLGAMAVVIVRKFPQLSLLDVDNVPEIKEEKKKEAFLRKRIESMAVEAKKARAKEIQPVIHFFKRIQLRFRQYVGRVERMVVRERMAPRKEEVLPKEKQEEKASQVQNNIKEGRFAYDQDDLELAEKKYIAAIKLDPKEKDAYRGLGDVYYKQGHLSEAKETYAFVTQLDPADDQVLVKLAEIAEEENDLETALHYYEQAVLLNDNLSQRFGKLAELLMGMEQYDTAMEAIKQAVELEPQNPKYLDMMVEISILVGDKKAAEEAFQALRMVNPENQKLPALRDKIDKIG